MKIGIDIRTLMDREYSGVSEYTLNLIKAILKLDSENEYKLFYNSGRDVSSRIPEFKGDNVQIIRTRYPNKIFNYLMQKTLSYPKIDKFLGVDLFWAPHINFFAFSKGCRKILTIHDLSFLRYPEFFSLRKNLWHYIINVRKLIRKFDKIVAISENTKYDIIELGDVDNNKIEVIYSGVGEQYRIINKNEPKYPELRRIREKYDLPEKFILHLGTLEPRKNVRGIIQAYNKLRDRNYELRNVGLVLAGGKGWKSKDIFAARAKSKYRDDIKFLGYIANEEKVYLYNLAFIFIYLSFYEGFGFPPLEAMACGVPVITSSVSSLPEVVGRASLAVDPYNTGDIAEAMEKIIIDQNLKNYLIEKSRIQVKRFTWENTAKKYLNIFK